MPLNIIIVSFEYMFYDSKKYDAELNTIYGL